MLTSIFLMFYYKLSIRTAAEQGFKLEKLQQNSLTSPILILCYDNRSRLNALARGYSLWCSGIGKRNMRTN